MITVIGFPGIGCTEQKGMLILDHSHHIQPKLNHQIFLLGIPSHPPERASHRDIPKKADPPSMLPIALTARSPPSGRGRESFRRRRRRGSS